MLMGQRPFCTAYEAAVWFTLLKEVSPLYQDDAVYNPVSYTHLDVYKRQEQL